MGLALVAARWGAMPTPLVATQVEAKAVVMVTVTPTLEVAAEEAPPPPAEAPIGVAAAQAPVNVAAVMAPLFITSEAKLANFDSLLDEAKGIGVNAVSVDVWWGEVEKTGDQSFDWSYYDQVFQKIRAKGFKIVPIMSFHKCGGGPGDNCNIPLPPWVWSHFRSAGLSANDLKYESETGNIQDDAIVPWASENPAVLAQFSEFVAEFEQHFAPLAGDFIEINLSLGPTGELRYPAYNGSDGWKYPDRGNFQAYSDLAQVNFRNWALAKYDGLSSVSNHWGIPLGSPDEIRAPGGQLSDNSGRRAQSFVDDNDYRDMQYGRDFIDWYNESLVGHGKRMLLASDTALDGPMKSLPLGMKIPGIHWQMQCAQHPRLAEITAGLIQTSLNTQARQPNAFGYRNVLEMVADVKQSTQREVILHFTALEMDNDANCGIGTSMAEALVFWISQAADDQGITHRGENALGCVNDPEGPSSPDNRSWERIGNAFTFATYSGFTFLRLTSETDKDGCVPWNSVDKERYKAFIQNHVSTQPDVIIHLTEWETCLESQGCRYNIHTFNGKDGTFPLHYETFANGRQWWVGTIPNTPATFTLTANNSNSWEGDLGQFDRTYNRATHSNEIYLLGRVDTKLYTSRP